MIPQTFRYSVCALSSPNSGSLLHYDLTIINGISDSSNRVNTAISHFNMRQVLSANVNELNRTFDLHQHLIAEQLPIWVHWVP